MEKNWLWKYLTSLGRDKTAEVAGMVVISAVWGWAYDLPGPILLCVLLGVAAFSASLINATQEWWQGTQTTLQVFLPPGKVLIGLILLFFFADNFVKEDQRTKRELEGELAATEEYIRLLSGKITDPYLTPRREERLREALKQIGPHTVSITYRDSPSSRPSGYVGFLGQVFQSALWKVEIYPKDQKEWPRREDQGLRIRIYDRHNPTSRTDVQQKVIRAFRESDIQIEDSIHDLPIGQNAKDRIELMIGDN